MPLRGGGPVSAMRAGYQNRMVFTREIDRVNRDCVSRPRPNRPGNTTVRSEGEVMRRYSVAGWILTIIALPAPLLHARGARRSTDGPAATVTLAYVTVASRRGIDTLIRVSNADTTEPIELRCALLNITPHCFLDPLQGCLARADCASGDVCAPAPPQSLQFDIG